MKSSFPLVERNLLDRHRKAWCEGSHGLLIAGKSRRYWPSDGANSSVFRARFPDATQLVRMGRCAVKRRIRFWHPWHMEQTHSDFVLSRKIDWFTPPNGDHEWIESLVRFDHMIDLAAAHRLTGERRYVDSFVSYLRSFSDSRSKPGRHWQYKLNPAIRVINIIRAYDLFTGTVPVDDPVHLLVYECLLTDIEFLKTQVGDATGNGAFFVTTALLIAALYLQEIFNTGAWESAAESRLITILHTEFQDDGFEAEQVPMYHGEVLLTLLDYCVALASNGLSIDLHLQSILRQMLRAIGQVSDPQGMIPPIGDSDRFDVNYLYHYYNSVFDDRASVEQDWGQVETGCANPRTAFQVRQMSATGWTVVRWRRDEHRRGYLLFDCSGKPRPGYGSHSHADDLQFLLHDSHGPIFTDPGRFTYCTDFKAFFPGTRRRINPTGKFRELYRLFFSDFMALAQRNWKEYFKSTLSHNTVSCGGLNQPGYGHRRAMGGLIRFERHLSCGPLLFLEGVLECDERPVDSAASVKYLHKRSLIGFSPDLWIVVDRVESVRKHHWISSFHVATGSEISSTSEFMVIKVHGDEHQFYGVSGLDECGGTVSVEDDWVSPVYNLKLPAKTIRIRSQRSEIAELLGVVYMGATQRQRMKRVELLPVLNESGARVGNNFLVHLNQDDGVTQVLVNLNNSECYSDSLSSNALVAFVSCSGGRVLEAGFIGGQYLRCRDVNLTASEGTDALHHTNS